MNFISDIEQSSNIALNNDKLRNFLPNLPPKPHKLILSSRIAALCSHDILEILILVKSYNDFKSDNDPNNERDFGSFGFGYNRILWKIDLSNGNKTQCLTVMFEDEY